MALLTRSVSLGQIFRRNFGASAVAYAQASDPIQKLFVQKIKEYDQKSKASPGKLVDASPETQKEMENEINRITKVFGGDGKVDMTKFPTFKFKDPELDPITIQQQ